MKADQGNTLAALTAETRFLRRLARTLTEWAELMQAGNHEALSESTRTTRMGEMFSALASSRVRLRQLAALDAASRTDASLQAEIADFRSACEELKMPALTVHALALRGMLYTHTMLAALSAITTYGENGFAPVKASSVTLGEA